MTHTPGPWERHEAGAIVGPKLDDKPVWLRPVIARFETGVKEADARLIAAAPELLEALEFTLAALEDIFGKNKADVGAINTARAAIAKARGQE